MLAARFAIIWTGHGELPDETLVAACPMSIRSSGESGTGGNRLFGRLQALGTTIADPLERLAAIVEETSVIPRHFRFLEQRAADGAGGYRAHHAAGTDGEGCQRSALFGPDDR